MIAGHALIRSLAGVVLALGLGVTIVPPAQAAAGSLTVYIEKEHYTCGPFNQMDCWDTRLHVNPAGWIKNRTISYTYELQIDGVLKDSDYEECYYTDGLSCNRWSKMFTVGPYPRYTTPSKRVCIKVTAAQRIVGTSTYIRESATDCFNTLGVVARTGRR